MNSILEIQSVSVIAVVAFTAIALATDLKNRRIPNWLTVSAAALGLAWHLFDSGLSGALWSLGGFATGFGVLLVLWLIGGGGGGDVKLMGAVGAWLGPMPTLAVFIASSIFALLCAIALVVWNKFATPPAVSAATVPADQPESPQTPGLRVTVPYALPVAMSIWTLMLIHFVD